MAIQFCGCADHVQQGIIFDRNCLPCRAHVREQQQEDSQLNQEADHNRVEQEQDQEAILEGSCEQVMQELLDEGD